MVAVHSGRNLVTALGSEDRKLKAIQEGLESLEDERADIDRTLEGLSLELEQIRQENLSLQVIAESYQNFPQILDDLIKHKKWKHIKELVAQNVSSIVWHQGREDPLTGRVEIMLFAQAPLPCPSHTGSARQDESRRQLGHR